MASNAAAGPDASVTCSDSGLVLASSTGLKAATCFGFFHRLEGCPGIERSCRLRSLGGLCHFPDFHDLFGNLRGFLRGLALFVRIFGFFHCGLGFFHRLDHGLGRKRFFLLFFGPSFLCRYDLCLLRDISSLFGLR